MGSVKAPSIISFPKQVWYFNRLFHHGVDSL